MRNVIIGYNWSENRTEESWLFWLQNKLVDQGFNVTISKIDEWPTKSTKWIKELQNIHQIDDTNIHIVPKDPGCLSLLLYIEQLAQTASIASAMLVAGSESEKAHQEMYNQYQLQSSQDMVTGSDSSNTLAHVVLQHKLDMIHPSIVVLYSAVDELPHHALLLKQ